MNAGSQHQSTGNVSIGGDHNTFIINQNGMVEIGAQLSASPTVGRGFSKKAVLISALILLILSTIGWSLFFRRSAQKLSVAVNSLESPSTDPPSAKNQAESKPSLMNESIDASTLNEPTVRHIGNPVSDIDDDKRPKVVVATAADFKVSYIQDVLGEVTRIKASVPYLNKLYASQQIPVTFLRDTDFDYKLPRLGISMLNNGDRPVLLSGIRCRIVSSMPDSRPVVIVSDILYNNMEIENRGWGEPQNLSVIIKYWYSLRMKTMAKTNTSVKPNEDLNKYIPQHLKRLLPADEVDEFIIGGHLSFYDYQRRHYKPSFVTNVHIGNNAAEHRRPMLISSGKYSTTLHVGGSCDPEYIPISHLVKPGEGELITLETRVDKSANFELELSLNDSDGTIVATKKILLDAFFPKYEGHLLLKKKMPTYQAVH